MLRKFRSSLLGLLAAGSYFLPCCLILLMDFYPGTSSADHLSSAAHLLAAGLILVLHPLLPSQAIGTRLPEEHKDQLRYALRSGALPLASLFSDWSGELAYRDKIHSLALRVLPAITIVVVLIDIYGVLLDPAYCLFSSGPRWPTRRSGLRCLRFQRSS